MEVEENQPPQKKLKQATLSFFKGRTTTKNEPQARKRHNSTSSESPSKVAKLSKPLAVLISSDSPNSKLTQQSVRSSIHDSSDQEVSSSSEADSTGSKSNGKSLMDRFVKKLRNDSSQEISSTNNDVDSTGVALQMKSGSDKENIFDAGKDTKIAIGENSSDSDCMIKPGEQDGNGTDNLITTESLLGDHKVSDIIVTEDKSTGSKNTDVGGKEEIESEENTSVTVPQDHENIDTDTAANKSIEMDTNEDSFTTSLDENSENICTSTPAKSVPESSKVELTPKSTPASSKKRGRKVDASKQSEKEALKQKQKEEKEEQRLAKKRKLEDEKAVKERMRKEKQEAKEKAKQELKEKQAQEKLEKEKLKEEERLKKEEERKQKEEQKLKKQTELEAKQEEKRKKEEEKRQKEEEKQKEEDEKRKKEQKVKMAFQSFFKAKETSQKITPSKATSGIFVPFELKKNMHLAPTLRRDALCQKKKDYLDQVLQPDQNSSVTTYLHQLRNNDLTPKRMGRILRKNPNPEEEMDIIEIHDSEALKKVLHKVKILQFHTDHRPPYCGTWRKETKLNPRDPFHKDEDVFDYEVDSDEEWEEEEPGESLSCSDGEGEEEKEDNEEEEEDGWMVPHGYLSEDEGCNEDDDISPENLKLQQLAKAKAWDEEQKRKFHALPVVVIGCFFEHSPSLTMSGDVRLLYEYKAVVLEKESPIPTALSTAFELPKCDELSKESGQTASLGKGPKKQSVPDEAMPDLIRLVHGNICGIKRLIREFRVFWLQKNKSSSSSLNRSYEEDLDESVKEQPADVSVCDDSAKDTIDTLNKSQDAANSSISKQKEEGYGCEISKRQLEIKIMAIAIREKRQTPKKTAWFVHNSVLTEFGVEDIQLPNSWVFLSSGPSISPAPKVPSTPVSKEEENSVNKDESTPAKSAPKDQRSIMDFTVTLTKEEMEELRQSQGESLMKSSENPLPQVSKPETTVEQVTTPKEKKVGGQRSIMDFAKSSAAKSCEKDGKSTTMVLKTPDIVIVIDEEEDDKEAPNL